MSPADSPFKFPPVVDREGDHQMIDHSTLQLPSSTPASSTTSCSTPDINQDSNITHQPTTNLDHPAGASAFWTNADMNNATQPSTNLPMTPLCSFDHLNHPSSTGTTTPSIDNSSSSGGMDSTHTTPASASTKFQYPFSTTTPGVKSANPNMLFRNHDLVQTPSTANTQWSGPTNPASAIDHAFMPPPPPNTSSSHGMHHTSHMSLTGLSPMLAGFTTSSPTFDQNLQSHISGTAAGVGSAAPSPINAQLNRPGGPIRTFSASAAIPQMNRKRSNTLMTLASSTPSSSSSATLNSYPYPSPRFPNSSINTHPHPHVHPSSLSQPTRLSRQPSVPIMTGEPMKRVFHPSPATAISPAIGVDLTHLPMDNDSYGAHRMGMDMNMGMPMGYNSMPISMGMGMGMGMRSTPPMEAKPPRFKPTKEQLEILIKSYEENKNPDGPAREALAKRLGPDVRPKTLQIWFQNRRSKSRAKERDANMPKSLHTRGGSSAHGHRSSASTSTSKGGSNKGVDIDALRGLIHDEDPNLFILPITVLSIANWTRFLMPGTGISHPDLAASLRFTPSAQPSLYLYVVHQTDTLRIEIPISTTSISNLQSVHNPSLNTEAVAISFELSMNTAKYSAWNGDDSQTHQGVWNEVGEFTGGETNGGGRCELTGDKEVLLSAFSRVQQYLSSQSFPNNMGGTNPTRSSSGSSWKFPSMSASTSFSSTAVGGVKTPPLVLPILGHLPSTTHHQHQRQRSFSQPDMKSSSSGASGDSSSLSEFEYTSKAMNFAQNQNQPQITSGQVPLPLASATSTSTNTSTATTTFDHVDTFSNPNQPFSSTWNSPDINLSMNTGGAGEGSLSSWGFPSTADTNSLSSTTLNPSTLSIGPGTMLTAGEGDFDRFATLNSGINIPFSHSQKNQYMGENQSEGSSEMDLGTPPFEFEDKSQATTVNLDDLGGGGKKGKDRFLGGLESGEL
ncbi:hypothetical protein V865_007023 [Kwoniella europaea PYCC6329]|uniref:Homeobox domain-containing protein n=1 Tax=Kwoniella europaea PYCC6329 TaxID=1423913 RepID=A0AAX4KS97_9TREE